MAEKRCSCPVTGGIRGYCPFSYANGWHERRRAILLQSDLGQAAKEVAAMTTDQITAALDGNDEALER